MATSQVRISASTHRIPADGKSSVEFELEFSDNSLTSAELRLSGLGSFAETSKLQRLTVPVDSGQARVRIYAPWRPGKATLCGPGFRKRIEFPAVSFVQALMLDWMPTLGIALLLALLLKSYAFANFFVPSSSMESTLMIGDLFIADKLSYKVLQHEPKRGDIMVFKHPTEPGDAWVKRIIGLPGDQVMVRDGKVWINDEPLDEDYIKDPPRRAFGPTTVPEDEYFVMGDNRNNSRDSREWGFLPRENLLGRAALIIWPPSHAQVVPRQQYDLPPVGQ